MNKDAYRLLFTQPTSGGGSDLSLYELVRGLDKSKYRPIVMFSSPSPYQELFEGCGVKVIVLSERVSPMLLVRKRKAEVKKNKLRRLIAAPGNVYSFLLQDIPLAFIVAHIMRSERIDLVHHNLSLSSARPMVLAAKLANVPQVCHFRKFGRIPYIAMRLARFVDAFIYISEAISTHYRIQGLPANKGHLIYNGINVDAFSKVSASEVKNLLAELGMHDQGQVISNVGRLDSWKGQDYFLQAMAEVVRTYPTTKILIVGDGFPTSKGQRYKERLETLVSDLELSKHVIFTGFRADIPQIMASSDVIVHSASEPEPFGRVIAEAMLAARPVVATAAGGVLDIIEDRETGMLVPLRNASAMAAAIKQLLADPEKAKDIGMRAQNIAKKRFSVKQHVSAMEQVYQGLLTKKRSLDSYRCKEVLKESDDFK